MPIGQFLNSTIGFLNSATNYANRTISLTSQTVNSAVGLGRAIGNLFGGSTQIGSGKGGITTVGGLSPTKWLNNYISQAYSENGI